MDDFGLGALATMFFALVVTGVVWLFISTYDNGFDSGRDSVCRQYDSDEYRDGHCRTLTPTRAESH